ncbi:MAG: D-glycero-beta-D-manno-heptose 1-phosphate adenylyltransferase [bacterium]|nr:D-glycero-beta-D-manno-heptose 1-phosphate adenylyltransferase [bacterium]
MNIDKIKTIDELKNIISNFKTQGKKIVFTNGCFDLLHLGHVKYLQEAKNYGDILVVAINSDSSVKAIKGKTRPLIPQEDRAQILSALMCIDYVVIFDELDPARIISELVPDVLIKGGDYQLDEIKGREIVISAGGQVLTIPEIKGKSTTNLIQTIVEKYK